MRIRVTTRVECDGPVSSTPQLSAPKQILQSGFQRGFGLFDEIQGRGSFFKAGWIVYALLNS